MAGRPSLEELLGGGAGSRQGARASRVQPRATRSAGLHELLQRLAPCGLASSKPHPRWRREAGTLALQGSGLEDEGVERLVDVLVETGCCGGALRRLDLSGCRVGPRGCCSVARLLGTEACSLEMLDLSANPLRGLGFSALRPAAQSVGAVDADRGVVALAHAVLRNPHSVLAELRLQRCGVGSEGSRALRRLASGAVRLWMIRVGENSLCTGSLPVSSGSRSGWELPACCHVAKTDAWIAFAMGQHRRLGGGTGSVVYLLPPPLMRKIFEVMWRCTVHTVAADSQGDGSAAWGDDQIDYAGSRTVAMTQLEPEPEPESEQQGDDDAVPSSWDDEDTSDEDEPAAARGDASSGLDGTPSRRSADPSSPLWQSDEARVERVEALKQVSRRRCQCECEVALFCVRTPVLRSKDEGWGHWSNVLSSEVPPAALAGEDVGRRSDRASVVRPATPITPPVAPRLGTFLVPERGDEGAERVVLPNLAEVWRALHPPLAQGRLKGVADDPAMLLGHLAVTLGLEPEVASAEDDPAQRERDGAQAAEVASALVALGLQPWGGEAAIRGARSSSTGGVFSLVTLAGQAAPSVCDVSAALLEYRRDGGWWEVERQRREMSAREPPVSPALRAAAQPWEPGSSGDPHRQELAAAPVDIPRAASACVVAGLGSPAGPASPEVPSHRFGEGPVGANITCVDDYSAFEEDRLFEWRRHRDLESGRVFHVNSKTGEKRWRKPTRVLTLPGTGADADPAGDWEYGPAT